jgi:hypothetical protein
MSLTGQVWHAIGMPRGLALSIPAFPERNPAAATPVDAFLKKSLLEIIDIRTSVLDEFE